MPYTIYLDAIETKKEGFQGIRLIVQNEKSALLRKNIPGKEFHRCYQVVRTLLDGLSVKYPELHTATDTQFVADDIINQETLRFVEKSAQQLVKGSGPYFLGILGEVLIIGKN